MRQPNFGWSLPAGVTHLPGEEDVGDWCDICGEDVIDCECPGGPNQDAFEDHAPDAFCPSCPDEGTYIGTLGDFRWYRCRNCGMEFHR